MYTLPNVTLHLSPPRQRSLKGDRFVGELSDHTSQALRELWERVKQLLPKQGIQRSAMIAESGTSEIYAELRIHTRHQHCRSQLRVAAHPPREVHKTVSLRIEDVEDDLAVFEVFAAAQTRPSRSVNSSTNGASTVRTLGSSLSTS